MTFGDVFHDALTAPLEVTKSHDVRRRRVTWLKNAKIDEVSLVPKGANRRRFTVFKSAEGAPADAFLRLERVLVDWLAG